MGKTSVDQYNSFNKIGHLHAPFNNDDDDAAALDQSDHPLRDHVDSLSEVSEGVDAFLVILSSIDHKSAALPEIPHFVKTFSENLETRIDRYNAEEGRFGKITEQDSLFMDSVRRISRLSNALSDFPPDHSNVGSSLNQSSVALQRAMAFLEGEFRLLLEPDSNDHTPDPQSFHKFSSFNANINDQHDHNSSDLCTIHPGEPDLDYPAYTGESMAKMQEIASSMISAGYETECCQVYYLARRNAIRNQMVKLEREVVLNMEEVVKMPWDMLETEISRWINMVKTWSNTLLPGEKRLGESIFSDYPSVHRGLHSNIIRTVVIQLLDFAEAAVMAKRSAEKLFKYLDMHEALQNLIGNGDDELMEEVSATIERVGESAASIFTDLENSIKSDVARIPVPGGAVHPLTRYVMNYLKYASEYKDTLQKVFAKRTELALNNLIPPEDLERESESPETIVHTTPFSIQVVTLMNLLDDNLERKSTIYKDQSLRNVFLMNNGRYILQKVKGSNEIKQVMGDTWCRKRSTVVRMYHKNYQRETWNRVLQCLSHDGLVTNGKANKPLLKERFKIFTSTFDEIHRTQSAWLVSDEQLQSELRISISSVVIPAYRSFVGRFRQYLDSGKHVDRYIKYQPEDIEGLIEGLFEGNTSSMVRRRT